MDIFWATAGCEAIMKVSNVPYPTNLEDLTFEKISQIIKRNMKAKKRLIVAERKFMSMKQEFDEPIIKYLHEMRVDIVSLKNLEKKNRLLKRT